MSIGLRLEVLERAKILFRTFALVPFEITVKFQQQSFQCRIVARAERFGAAHPGCEVSDQLKRFREARSSYHHPFDQRVDLGFYLELGTSPLCGIVAPLDE